MELVNGYPNRWDYRKNWKKKNILRQDKSFIIFLFRFWGWGAEDDDFRKRLEIFRLPISKVNSTLGIFQVRIIT